MGHCDIVIVSSLWLSPSSLFSFTLIYRSYFLSSLELVLVVEIQDKNFGVEVEQVELQEASGVWTIEWSLKQEDPMLIT